MAASATKFGVLYDASMIVNAVDLSNDVESVKIGPFTTNPTPGAAMGDIQDYSLPGTQKVTLTANFYQDFASAKVDQTLFPLWSGRVSHAVVVKPTAGTLSASNPGWSGSWFISSYDPGLGARGSNVMAPVTWEPAGLITRITS